jgi:hypothetical protein
MGAATGIGLLAVGSGASHRPSCGGPVRPNVGAITCVTPKGWLVLIVLALTIGS